MMSDLESSIVANQSGCCKKVQVYWQDIQMFLKGNAKINQTCFATMWVC